MPTVGAKVPGVQGEKTLRADWPHALPTGHNRQDDVPDLGAYVPGEQLDAAIDPVAQKVPDGHMAGSTVPLAGHM